MFCLSIKYWKGVLGSVFVSETDAQEKFVLNLKNKFYRENTPKHVCIQQNVYIINIQIQQTVTKYDAYKNIFCQFPISKFTYGKRLTSF